MKKRRKIPNMQRRRKEQKPVPQEKVPEPSTPDFDDAQIAEFMAKAEAAFTSTGSQTRYFVHGPMGLQSQQEPDGTWRFPIQDGLSSIRGVADEALSILESREYDPFGNLMSTQGTAQTPFGFAGEMTDPNGLVYLRNRYYNPALGVFPNPDPISGNVQQPMSLNLYAYAHNNPVNWVDPSGMVTLPSYWDPCSQPQQHIADCSCCPSEQAHLCDMGQVSPCPCPPLPFPPRCPGNATTAFANANGECCYRYIGTDAVTYARDNVNNLPPQGYYYWGENGGDCANFVSQALRDGNLPMHDPFESDDPNGWGCKTKGTKTCHATNQNWTMATDLRNYLADYVHAPTVPVASPAAEGYVLTEADMSSLSDINSGDVLYIPQGSGHAHVAVVTGRGPAYASWANFIAQENPLPFDVPYAIDHGFIDQGTVPRPYYLFGWSPPRGEGWHYDATGTWEFIKMSEVLKRCVPVDKIIPFIPFEER